MRLQDDFEDDATSRNAVLSEGTYTISGYHAADDSDVGKTVGTVNSSGVFEGDEKLFVVDNTYNFVCVANGDELLEEDKTFKMSRNATNRPTISNTVMNQSLTTDVNKEIAFEMKHTEARVRVKLTGNGFSDVQAYLLPTSGSHPKSAVWNIYKNDFLSYPTGTSVTNEDITTAEYTFNFNNTSGDNLVSEYKYLLPGTNGSDLILNLEGKISDVAYNGSIKLKNLGVLGRNKTYLVNAAVKINSGSGNILYFKTNDSGERMLMIGTWPDDIATQNDLAFFKFGSVVGFKVIDNASFGNVDKVAYNPSLLSVGKENSDDINRFSVDGVNDLPGIPGWVTEDRQAYINAAEWDKYSYCVSGENYHTVDNIKKGKGDPCKLVGYTETEVRTILNNGNIPDNKQWRLPTKNEQLAFAKASLSASGTTFNNTNYKYWDNTANWNGATNYTYGTFPFIGNSNLNPSGSKLPAAGKTNGWGSYQEINTAGAFWSSTPSTDENNLRGLCLFFNKTHTKTDYNSYSPADGCTIRCVPQNP